MQINVKISREVVTDKWSQNEIKPKLLTWLGLYLKLLTKNGKDNYTARTTHYILQYATGNVQK